MTAKQLLGMLFCKSWWTYGSGNPEWFEIPYHFFNLLEGAIWVILSALVLARYIRYRHSIIEVIYSAAFFTFGLTDFREAYAASILVDLAQTCQSLVAGEATLDRHRALLSHEQAVLTPNEVLPG